MLPTLLREGNTSVTIPPVKRDSDEEDLKLAFAIVKAMLEVMPRQEVRSFLERVGA